ncbi:unnamed protein product [Hermetia illucens]|uniref:C2H2-type domain-containing protein n=1 Tax=Hermetia illucens TaxID=343691 RepID=A0A7R8UH09_HERIL|nr:zinc finger protein 14-like [Hermetia illucens]CAD7080453.1 unnamed protein product [Hermetia illucens]
MEDNEVDLLKPFEIKPELGIKEEVFDEYLKDTTSECSPDFSNYGSKCGSIFSATGKKYVFVCEFCNEGFECLESFGSHLEEKHFESISQEACEEVVVFKVEVESSCDDEPQNEDFPPEYNQLPEVISHLSADETSSDTKSVEPKTEPTEEPNPSDSTEQTYTCETCNRDFTVRKTYVRHCRYCKKRAAENLKPIDKNIVQLTLEPPNYDNEKLLCITCNRQFDSKRTFSYHKTYHRYKTRKAVAKLNGNNSKLEDLPEDAKVTCSICNRQFRILSHLKDHAVRTHKDEIPTILQEDPMYLKCKCCFMEFEKPTERFEHEKTHTESKPFRCSMCPKSFALNCDRGFHENLHTGARPYTCPHCPNTFTHPNIRDKHIRIHSDTKRYSCEYCGDKFSTSFSKKYHIRIHKDERPCQCDLCGARFRSGSHLIMHKKRHANQRDHQCDLCEKRFVSRDQLRCHRATHMSERPYKCRLCTLAFRHRKNLAAHEKRHKNKAKTKDINAEVPVTSTE